MQKICYFFLVTMISTVTIKILAEEKTKTQKQQFDVSNDRIAQLPDEDSTVLNSVLSAIGGFSGGGLFLIFMIRRLVNSYDESFAKWETRCSGHNLRQDEKDNKIISMIKEVHYATQDLKVELVKLQANATDKDSITETITKVDMMEADINQVRNEVKSIMDHLLNKPKTSIGRS